ncbi:enoyl-CoA hydratase/isomerase family protein [Dyella mobilis]|uniref:3-hydroxyisobutyryl-CoA hydrolase n=1 Tax=Dyella mobilis TaxID=1849582 RepID=A0ABS2KB92_9GAMM|nr:enoyl-CoA hydratase/isomerase family protein [Dyella mobilis]MBM7128067.1 enoyl-CoA hydratase/isomerase family protein [Dyella mobilis]GLR00040.1 enoyl-CoA hydratase [Dyella mobilis]
MNTASASSQDEAPVLFEERVTANGKRIGIATLHAPKTLNGLSLDMARLLDGRLHAWAKDDGIALVVLQGAGEKAFCAGGDLHGLHRSMTEYRAAGHRDIRDNAYASNFFAVEYRLDYRIHTYPKPLLCWGHGIVMGGGIGLMSGASHRVVTERSKLAFPEITVGLYPDVGGTWLLHRVPARGGLFLALTGAPLNAGDAIYAGMADVCIEDQRRQQVFDALTRANWKGTTSDNANVLTSLLQEHASQPAPGPLQKHQALIEQICAHEALEVIAGAIRATSVDDPWVSAARETFATGAPSSARIAFELQRRAPELSLADVFRLEYIVSLHCAARGDFAEGIRALLIDKDRQPHWQPKTLAEATSAWSETFFQAPWHEGDHPLANLGARHEATNA